MALIGHPIDEPSPRDRPRACERCGAKGPVSAVVGEEEGMVVYACPRCRRPSRFPMLLPRRLREVR